MSHSQVVEWIFGSRIQSHWPWRMLWPISMFSRILATLRPAVPTIQAGGKMLARSTARLPSSSLRWTLMTLRMYAASASPRSSRISWRISSSSLPSSSMSSAVRWAMGLVGFFCRAVMGRSLSVVDVAGAGGGADTGLDEDAVTRRRGGELAVAQVAHGALAQRQHAAEADAHPASARHEHAGLLGGVEDGLVAARLDDGAGLAEGQGAALAGHDDRRAEPLEVQRQTLRGVVGLERLEQAGRPAGVRRAVGDVRHDRVQVVHVE